MDKKSGRRLTPGPRRFGSWWVYSLKSFQLGHFREDGWWQTVAKCLGVSVFPRLYAVHAIFSDLSFLEFRNSYYTRNRLLYHIDDDAFARRNAF